MQFDPDNKVVQLCAQGIEREAQLKPEEAKELFLQAWNESITDFEKFTSAHYVARHQSSIEEKLQWDITAIECALRIESEEIKGVYPSLYLNIGKGYEDLGDNINARKYYQLANSFMDSLLDDGYGTMIKGGITNGLERVSINKE
jgi:rifampin ADP-ribosylating transferase